MTAIAGIIASEDETSVAAKLQTLLAAMNLRGTIKQTLIIKEKQGAVAIGSCSHPGESSADNLIERTSFAADGPTSDDLRAEEIGGLVSAGSLSEAIGTGEPFTCVGISSGSLLAGRDLLGQKPLYTGTSKGLTAFTTLRHSIHEIGIDTARPVPPGQLVAVSGSKQSIVSDRGLSKPKEIRVTEQEAIDKLNDLMLQSLEEGLPKNPALAFSGGLDSSLVAYSARENDLQPELITVSMKGQPELDHAFRISKELGLALTTRELSSTDVLEAVPDVINTIESEDPVLVAISLPIYYACETAQELGTDCMLAGQLSDELFAGYGRFDDLALGREVGAVRDEIWKSVQAASSNDFETGDKLAVSHRMELRCPFAFLPLVRYALQLPVSLKLRVEEGRVVRKYILRRLAAHWELPSSVVDKPKKAVQYSSGVQKVLLKEARRRKVSLGELVKSLRSNS